jgi:hypothetical protein
MARKWNEVVVESKKLTIFFQNFIPIFLINETQQNKEADLFCKLNEVFGRFFV